MTSGLPSPITLPMLSAHRFLGEVIASLRNIIAPAVADPYAKAQAYMAAVLLEFVSRQVEERHDIALEKERALTLLFQDLSSTLAGKSLPESSDTDQEARLCRLIEWLYAEKDQLGPEVFSPANQRIRETLRQLLAQELKVAGNKESL
ncbi:MAG: hypothetical protein ACRERD_01300 [Candidatus Binatia bacterium]